MPRARSSAIALLATLALALTGCGSDGPSATPSPTASAATSDSASPTPETSATTATTPTSPTSPTSPSVTPATGERVDLHHASFNLPPGFMLLESSLDSPTYVNTETFATIASFQFPNLGNRTVDQLADDDLTGADGKGATRQPDRVIDGETVFVITRTDPVQGDTYSIGLPLDDEFFKLDITATYPDETTTPLVESVLASLTFS